MHISTILSQLSEDDTKRAQHLAESIAAGGKLDRKVYRIRNKEVSSTQLIMEFKLISSSCC